LGGDDVGTSAVGGQGMPADCDGGWSRQSGYELDRASADNHLGCRSVEAYGGVGDYDCGTAGVENTGSDDEVAGAVGSERMTAGHNRGWSRQRGWELDRASTNGYL